MAFIFGTQIAGESDDHPKLTGALLPRLCQSCPLDGDLGRNVVLPSRLGEGGKAFQVRTLVPQDETSCPRSEEHTSELQSRLHLVCRLLLEKKKNKISQHSVRVHTRTCPCIIVVC